MPQPLNNAEGSQLASAAPDGFESLDAYDASLQADAIEVPEDIMTVEGEEAPPAEAPETEATETETETEAVEGEEAAEEMEWEIEGRGKLSASDIVQLLDERDQVKGMLGDFDELKEKYDAANTEAQDLSKYSDLQKFFERNPDIWRKLESEIGEFEKLAEKNLSTDPHVASLQKQNNELMEWKREVEIAQADQQIDGIFDALGDKYPDVVDDKFRNGVLTQVYGAFKGDPRFGVKTLAAAAKTTAYLMSEAMKKATQNGTDAAVRAVKKPGVVRLVPAGRKSDAKPKAKDYSKMSPDQLADAFADEVN